MNISETSWPIIYNLSSKALLGGRLAALGFGPDRISTLVSMATDSSHRGYKGENLVSTLALPIFTGSPRGFGHLFQGNRGTNNIFFRGTGEQAVNPIMIYCKLYICLLICK